LIIIYYIDVQTYGINRSKRSSWMSWRWNGRDKPRQKIIMGVMTSKYKKAPILHNYMKN